MSNGFKREKSLVYKVGNMREASGKVESRYACDFIEKSLSSSFVTDFFLCQSGTDRLSPSQVIDGSNIS